ncbi:ferritin-like domain-containing protein [Rhodobacter sp. KR11]|uniref:YciE/YciF ferroxidase family protein n=1 Tax=Rhodobacter sp. KR11 TaxID=2974588 RepID=UPI0022218C8C|nr:ferritin-like domain-containing protein [Rhodobacter sp. KR11]MCW1917496.1 ferritin-like domain-containing protein [Rhodobacter sp. KR11]
MPTKSDPEAEAKPARPAKPSPEKGLVDLFEHALRDMYYAEKKILKSLPKMIRAAQNPALKSGLTLHKEETAAQIDLLEQVFESIGKRAKGETCEAIDGILEECAGLLEDFAGSPAGDAAIIFSAQAVEHYEITRYGSMVAFAKALGLKTQAKLLGQILAQEAAADKSLSDLAESEVNAAAKAA